MSICSCFRPISLQDGHRRVPRQHFWARPLLLEQPLCDMLSGGPRSSATRCRGRSAHCRFGAEPFHHHWCNSARTPAAGYYAWCGGPRDEANRELDRRNATVRGRQVRNRSPRPRPQGRDWAARSRLQQHGFGTRSRARTRSRRSSPYRCDANWRALLAPRACRRSTAGTQAKFHDRVTGRRTRPPRGWRSHQGHDGLRPMQPCLDRRSRAMVRIA
jgi:hypothetical protein